MLSLTCTYVHKLTTQHSMLWIGLTTPGFKAQYEHTYDCTNINKRDTVTSNCRHWQAELRNQVIQIIIMINTLNKTTHSSK